MRRNLGESRFIIIHFRNAASFLYGTGCCLSLAQSATVKIKNIVASADMRRHSDTLRGAQRRRKRGLRGENNRTSFLRSEVVVFPSFFFVFPSYTKDIVFSRTCAGKRHPESRERGDRKGANGGKREGERSEQESVVTRQNKNSRRVGGHAPPQRHLERSAATMKTRFTGRKQNKRKRILLSSRLLLSCYSYHTHRHIVTRRGRLAPPIDYRAGKGCGGL